MNSQPTSAEPQTPISNLNSKGSLNARRVLADASTNEEAIKLLGTPGDNTFIAKLQISENSRLLMKS
jgi:hypothetical protein